jgi:hypothetical protein
LSPCASERQDKSLFERRSIMGVTTGANCYGEKKYKDNPSQAPTDEMIRNNIVTWWEDVFKEWF